MASRLKLRQADRLIGVSPGRLWPGVHRHAVTVMLAYSFLVWLELQQRRSAKS